MHFENLLTSSGRNRRKVVMTVCQVSLRAILSGNGLASCGKVSVVIPRRRDTPKQFFLVVPLHPGDKESSTLNDGALCSTIPPILYITHYIFPLSAELLILRPHAPATPRSRHRADISTAQSAVVRQRPPTDRRRILGQGLGGERPATTYIQNARVTRNATTLATVFCC